jgi:hypothetical protein
MRKHAQAGEQGGRRKGESKKTAQVALASVLRILQLDQKPALISTRTMPRGGSSSGGSSGRGGGSRGGSSPSAPSKSSSSSSSKASPTVRLTTTGKVDGRSSAVRSGDVLLTASGAIDGRSAAVKSGAVLVKQDGGLDKRSAAYDASPATTTSSVASHSSSSSSSLSSPAPNPIRFKSDGHIDGRSSLVKTGDLLLTSDGEIDGRSKAVRDGRILLKNDGDIDQRSRYAPSTESVQRSKIDKCYAELVQKKGMPGSDSEMRLLQDYAEYKVTGKLSTNLLRHHSNQAKKREDSESKYLDTKHAAHKLALEVIVDLVSHKAGPRFGFARLKAIRETVNPIEGFRMVLEKTNLSQHRRLDAKLMEKGWEISNLTQEEASRAIQAAQSFRSFSAELPDGLLKVGIEFFTNLRTTSDISIWDLTQSSTAPQ